MAYVLVPTNDSAAQPRILLNIGASERFVQYIEVHILNSWLRFSHGLAGGLCHQFAALSPCPRAVAVEGAGTNRQTCPTVRHSMEQRYIVKWSLGSDDYPVAFKLASASCSIRARPIPIPIRSTAARRFSPIRPACASPRGASTAPGGRFGIRRSNRAMVRRSCP